MKQPFTRRVLSLFLVFLLLTTLLPSALAESEPTAPAAPSISLNKKTLSLAVSGTETLTATVEPAGTNIAWSSSQVSAATVDSNGKVTAVAPGETTISATVTNDGKTATGTCIVTVTAATVTITLDPSLTLKVSEKRTLTASISMTPDTATPPTTVTWSCDKPAVATVNSSTGEVTALAPGTANITVAAGTGSAVCHLTVPGIALTKTSLSLTVGNSDTLSKSLHGGISPTGFTWSSSNDAIANVDGNGRVTAISAGNTTITVQSEDGQYTASCSVSVTENMAGVISTSARTGQALSFGTLESQINSRCQSMLGSSLNYVTNLSVSTQAGILYYGYASDSDPGAGVGSVEKYYYNASGGNQRKLSLVSFVPSSGFSGTAVISYSGFDSNNRMFTGEIRVDVEASRELSYTTTRNTPVTFRAEDFSALCRTQNGRDLSHVTFSIPSTSYGTLYYNYTGSGNYESLVKDATQYHRTRTPYLDSVTFVPAADYTGTVRISYVGVDTSGYSFSGRVSVTVNQGNSTNGNGKLSYRTSSGTPIRFNNTEFNNACYDVLGNSLDYVRFDLPSSSKGTLYYNYRSSGSYDNKVSDSTRYYRNSSPYISNVSFVPYSGFSGTVDLSFTGWDTSGNRFTGTVTITVDGNGSSSGRFSYRTKANTALAFDAADFNTACRDVLGNSLDYVRFDLPSSSKGTLYYNYRSSGSYDNKVSDSTRYYRNSSPYISNVSFVPYSGFSGTVDLSFTGWDTSGNRFTGTVTITVDGNGSSSGRFSYRTKANTVLAFDAADFNTACRDVLGNSLDYVRFDLPSSSKGTLYYNYRSSGSYDNKVSDSTRYYRNSSPYISNVSFVPYSGFSGTVDLSFTGWDSSGNRFTGTVTITVDSNGSSAGKFSYRTKANTALAFDAADFNTACRDALGTPLNYVRFDLPSSSKGTLYYNYRSSGSYDNKVSDSSSYYRNSSPYISNVSFVPYSGFSGTVDLSFTGWDTSGNRFTGTVTITVDSNKADSIRYVATNGTVSFHSQDFQRVCDNLQDKDLSRVQFTLPAANVGRLIYHDSANADSPISTSTSYYKDRTPSLDQVRFVASAGYVGTTLLSYTGVDSAGTSFEGQVELVVPTVVSRFSDMGNYSWASASVAFLQEKQIVQGLSATEYGPARALSRADFVVMLCRAFQISPGGSSHFVDVPADSYYAASVAAAETRGIVKGNGTSFSPTAALTREDAMVMLQRAMQATGWILPDGTYNQLASFPDGTAVSTYAVGATAALVNLGILQGDSSGRLQPKATLSRAEMAVILHRVLAL